MMKLYAGTKPEDPNLRWEAYASWAQFSWLYLLSAVSALRSALFFKLGVEGWETWIIGAGILLACAAILRHWAHYELRGDEVMVRNGYTGREIQSIPLSDVGHVDIQQGIVADFFGIGTVLVHVRGSDRLLALRGVSDPEKIKILIESTCRRSEVLQS